MDISQTSSNVRSGIIGIWLGILVGAVLAGAVTLFFAPGKGPDNRAMIKKRFSDAREAIIWHARDEAQKVGNKNTKIEK